jgi:hypothetical protein
MKTILDFRFWILDYPRTGIVNYPNLESTIATGGDNTKELSQDLRNGGGDEMRMN